ncbi:MAG TPA: hypothetical protein RMH99_28590 [Sandaracinaceae bacterium LLY-WYZ-13_1]|nr:hypothetical protein [Sandaracinaceae bacterium LLY-WYZ-13_1]
MDRPPHLALVEGGAESPFDALLRAAEHDPDAARGLALAYAAMSPAEREALIATVVVDAEAAGRSPAPVLALLLSVEDEPALSDRIAGAMLALEDAALGAPRHDAGWIWGDDRRGGVVTARHLHGDFVELSRVRWADGAVDVEREPLARAEDPAALRRRMGVPEEATVVALEHAVARLAEALWRERVRRGALPEGLRPIADLF